VEPLLSIIIPSFNAVRYVDECLSSVASQFGDDVEVIVQDGGSTDGTAEVFERYRSILSSVEIGPDHGQSDAIDRGIQLARGRFLTWLNADDILMPGTLAALRKATRSQPVVDWWVGDTVVLDSDSLVKSATRAGSLVNWGGFRFACVYGPSSFFTKHMYQTVGGLDLSFHYMMDTELWSRFATQGYRFQGLGHYAWGFRQHEGSKTTARMFSDEEYDVFAPSQYRQNAERLECYLRHGITGGGRREAVAMAYAKAARALDFSLALQVLDGRINQGRHWSAFRRWL